MEENINDYAIVVGVNHYKGINNLDGPDEDAIEFYKWLRSNNGGDIPKQNCHLILSDTSLEPIQPTIDERFLEIIDKVAENKGRRLYFYFSGHGIGLKWYETALLLPPWTERYRNCALSSSEYKNTLIESGLFEEVFFFLDCCRNRKVGITGASPGFGNARTAPPPLPDAYIYSATDYDNKAYEAVVQEENGNRLDNNKPRGIFSTVLMNGLKGGAEKKGVITSQSLANYININLPIVAKEKSKIQIPDFDLAFRDTIIVNNVAPLKTTVRIEFKKSEKKVILKNFEFNEIATTISNKDQPWTFELENGLYSLNYEGEESSPLAIALNGSQKIVNYEF